MCVPVGPLPRSGAYWPGGMAPGRLPLASSAETAPSSKNPVVSIYFFLLYASEMINVFKVSKDTVKHAVTMIIRGLFSSTQIYTIERKRIFFTNCDEINDKIR